MNVFVLPRARKVLGSAIFIAAVSLLQALVAWAGEQQIALRDYIEQEWKNELLTYPFAAPEGACQPESVTLAGPKGPVPVQLSEIELWPGSRRVKSARLSFIANLAPLATDTYTVSYGDRPAPARPAATDLTVTPGEDQVEITTRAFGVRLLQGEKTYGEPASAKDVPGPVIAMRLADGTWFGASRMFGPAKIASCSARLVDRGPVFARVAFRYTYANGNTMDLTVQVAAGDNAMRMETRVQKDQPKDGFELVLSRGLPSLVFQVQDERRNDRDCFTTDSKPMAPLAWAEIPLKDYVAPKGHPAGLVTKLTPWEDWFGTFTQTRIRLKLEGTARELQLRSLDAGAWVEPREIETVFDPGLNPDPAQGVWVDWGQKCIPVLKDALGEVSLQVNAAQGVRKWTVSECLSMPGVAALFHYYGYKSEREFPTETRPTIGYRLDEVKAQRIMERFLDQMVGPAGEWPEAMSHHGRTSIDMLLAFAIASTNSGLCDYVNDPRMKRLILYWAKLHMPRDPRPRGHHAFTRPNLRFFPAMGRDSMSVPGATSGAMARVTRHSDPAYSAHLQWAWLEEGASSQLQHLGGFAYVACDKRLPAQRPAWPSEVFPRAGAVLRHGLGTPDEHQVTLYCGDHAHAFYPGHTGCLASIFAYGTPLAGSFPGGYEYQEGFLTCHVDLAHGLGTMAKRKAVAGYGGSPKGASMWSWQDGETARFGQRGGLANVSALSALPRQDYAAVDVARHHPCRGALDWRTDLPEWPPVSAKSEPPVDWRRQVLFLKDDDPAKTAYLLIRDSIKGGQPTMWQMWTVSETVDTRDKVKDVAAVLAKKPGNQILPARELKGDRFTAIGQLGVDVEYYIASPSDTPRHTLRWGTDMFDWANKLKHPEYQDLLHLQMPGDGAYFVAFFPRKRQTPAPMFSTLGDGTIIKVSGDFGTDYGFLSALEAAASGEGASFQGTAASVQDRKDGLVLALGAKGEVGYKHHRLAAGFPVALRVRERDLTVEFPQGLQPPAFQLMQPFPGGTLTVGAPGAWALAKPLPGVKLTSSAAGFVLEVPSGTKTVSVVRGN